MENKIEYLRLLAKEYPSKEEVIKEIINLKAILKLPKGTEYFISDIHGEAQQFYHILNNCSGIIKEQVGIHFSFLNEKEKSELCFLVYYPKIKISQIKQINNDMKAWYKKHLRYLITLAKILSVQYTRSKVRKLFPEAYSYILDELLHMQKNQEYDTESYYNSIIESLIEEDECYSFLISVCQLIKKLAVDQLHIVGDLFDRGPRPDDIVDMLMEYHNVDIQWGNHDILWMGAASLNPVCVAGVVFNSIKYHNSQVLEMGYGISLRKLYILAKKIYPDFNQHDAAMNTIAMIMFKLEDQLLSKHPEYQMNDKLYLRKVNGDDIEINHVHYHLDKRLFSSVCKENPNKLTETEKDIIKDLMSSFQNSQRLHKHIDYIYKHGSLYKVQNNNLIYHGCIPLTSTGQLQSVTLGKRVLKGKSYFDFLDREVRKAYYEKNQESIDLMWFLWSSHLSPLCGRNVKYFEHFYIEELKQSYEENDHYYTMIKNEQVVDMILEEFGIKEGSIINGHIPIKVVQGESPIRCNGKVVIIDGGFCKAYHEKTGISGYTLIYDSKELSLRMHGGFDDLKNAIIYNNDMTSSKLMVRSFKQHILIEDCDNGKKIKHDLKKLKELLEAYRDGTIQCTSVNYQPSYEKIMNIFK